MKLAFALFALLMAFAPASAKTFEPVNEAGKDPELAALIATLVKACDEKDFKPFEAAMSPNAIASFGGDEGVEGFKREHDIDNPDTPFWAEFKTALLLGGAFMEDGLYGAPYVYANWPEDLDGYEYIVAVGDSTKLFSKPGADGVVVADVTHQFLQIVDGPTPPPQGWLIVKANGKQGFVKAHQARSPNDYRAVFQKTTNRWWIGAFVGGD